MVGVRRKQMACLYLLLVLMILPWEGSKFADGSARFNKFVSGPSSNQIHRDVQSHHGSFFKGNSEHKARSHNDDNGDGDDDDEGLLDEKRRIHTGPNPLHNR
ncbi:hypothetical protein Droror1_Dr00012853 [Drosera rotundifolia]